MADQRPADDESIFEDEILYFRIYPAPDATVPMPEGGFRPNSGSFKQQDKSNPVSVDLGSLCTPEQTRDRGPKENFFHVAQVSVMALRQLGFRVIRDPITDGPNTNHAHALVLGTRPNIHGNQIGGLTDREYRQMAQVARMLIITPPVPPPEN